MTCNFKYFYALPDKLYLHFFAVLAESFIKYENHWITSVKNRGVSHLIIIFYQRLLLLLLCFSFASDKLLGFSQNMSFFLSLKIQTLTTKNWPVDSFFTWAVNLCSSFQVMLNQWVASLISAVLVCPLSLGGLCVLEVLH